MIEPGELTNNTTFLIKIAAYAQMIMNVFGGLTICPLASKLAWSFE